MDQRAQIITEKIKPYTARVNELEESIRLKDEESMILRLAVEQLKTIVAELQNQKSTVKTDKTEKPSRTERKSARNTSPRPSTKAGKKKE